MIIVELCGLPGCGKSTLVNEYKKKYHNIKLYTRDDLLSHNKVIRRFNTLYQMLLFKLGLHYKKLECLYNFINEYSSSNNYYAVRLIDLYKKLICLSKKEGMILLEEGPIQYLSSIPFDEKIVISVNLKKALEILDTSKVIAIDCNCSIETSINRIKKRNKRPDRYSVCEGEKLEQLMTIKSANIKSIIQISDYEKHTLNMEDSIEKNVYELYQII